MKTYPGNSDTVWQELTTINVEIKGICSSEWFYRGCHTFILYVGILKVIHLILDAILLFLLAIVSFRHRLLWCNLTRIPLWLYLFQFPPKWLSYCGKTRAWNSAHHNLLIYMHLDVAGVACHRIG